MRRRHKNRIALLTGAALAALSYTRLEDRIWRWCSSSWRFVVIGP